MVSLFISAAEMKSDTISEPPFLATSIGRKVVMAVTGAVLFVFVVGHLIGNLQVFLGPQALDAYARALRRFPALLWGARSGLLIATALHVWAAWSLTSMNRRARPVGYRKRRYRTTTYAARTMRWSGVILLLFVVYHLAHFTWGVRRVHPDFREGAVYHNVVAGFRVVPVALLYVAAMVALGLHLRHGLWSMFDTVGWNHPRLSRLRDRCATVFALLITLGNVSIPLAVLAGIVR